jgi:vanillate O-demethylase ferredoxin subunit
MTALALKKVASNPKPEPMRVRVRSIMPHGPDINCYEVVDSGGGKLPAFEPGSHIDVSIPGEDFGVRQYSLCGDPQDCNCYRFAVQRELNGRGGSKAIFDRVKVGTNLTISQPRNNFALHPTASHHLLVAGGIGITPMISMLHHLKKRDADFTLHYCTRSPERTAFQDLLQPLIAEGRVFLHWDNGDPAKGLNLTETLKDYQAGTHLYYCGPPGFMGAVAAACSHWPTGTTHREYFTPSANDPGIAVSEPDGVDAVDGELGPPFQVKIASTGDVYDIPSNKSVLNVLRDHGVQIETQCELGVCGTCRTRYLEGEPDHRDFVLEADEHKREMTICCSRSKSPLLVLDL